MNNLKSTISQVIEENLISTEWSDAVNTEVKNLNLNTNNHPRKDLTKVPFVTIDGADAKDFDDAVFCNLNDSGFLLNVAIADVAELVNEDSYLDQEAKKRGTSIYFPSKVIPMLPEKISNNLCSLVPDEIRNVLVSEINFSLDGSIKSYKFFQAKIMSHKRMTYAEVEEYIKNNNSNVSKKIKDLMTLSKLLEKTLSTDDQIQTSSKAFAEAKGSMFLGRGYSYPIALEGALKLKELAYVHAEGYPAGEMKHGPLALIEEGMPVVVLAPRDEHYKKTVSNMQEVISRGAKVLLITNKSKDEIYSENIWQTIVVEKTSDDLLPFLITIPLQKLAYYSALHKGYDIDKPRNLAKSVTVE